MFTRARACVCVCVCLCVCVCVCDLEGGTATLAKRAGMMMHVLQLAHFSNAEKRVFKMRFAASLGIALHPIQHLELYLLHLNLLEEVLDLRDFFEKRVHG